MLYGAVLTTLAEITSIRSDAGDLRVYFCRVGEHVSTAKDHEVPVHSMDDLQTATACRQRGFNGSSF